MSGLLYTTDGGKKNLPRVKCIKCGRIGNLTIKKTKSHGTTYEYYYVQHYMKESDKIEWCYLGSYEGLPKEYERTLQKEKTIHNEKQHCTQKSSEPNNLKSSPTNQNKNEKSNASIAQSVEQQPCKLQVAGSIPARGSTHIPPI
jgi:hypothetical protein